MNFLAHLYLSGSDDEVKTGNYLGDFCTAKQIEKLPVKMQRGIELHREIDKFTDASEEFAQLVKILRPGQGKYSPVIADIVFDHFLAVSPKYFKEKELEAFAAECYRVLHDHREYLPPKALRFLTFACEVDVFTAYAKFDGVDRVFKGMGKRAAFKNNMSRALVDLKENYTTIQDLFDTFFPRLQLHCEAFREQIGVST